MATRATSSPSGTHRCCTPATRPRCGRRSPRWAYGAFGRPKPRRRRNLARLRAAARRDAAPVQPRRGGAAGLSRRWPRRNAARVGNRSCNGIFGRYELREFELAPDGKPTRLWLIYEAFCDSYTDASFGEIRFNARVPEAQSHVAPGIVRWPVIEARGRTTEVPVSYLGSAPVASVAVAGAHPGDFALDPSGCASSAGPCDVRVRFVPTAGGERTATLRFTDTAGGVHETTLEGYAHGGTNAADVELVPRGADRALHGRDDGVVSSDCGHDRDGVLPARPQRRLVLWSLRVGVTPARARSLPRRGQRLALARAVAAVQFHQQPLRGAGRRRVHPERVPPHAGRDAAQLRRRVHRAVPGRRAGPGPRALAFPRGRDRRAAGLARARAA